MRLKCCYTQKCNRYIYKCIYQNAQLNQRKKEEICKTCSNTVSTSNQFYFLYNLLHVCCRTSQVITIGRHVKGYHYIIANLVSFKKALQFPECFKVLSSCSNSGSNLFALCSGFYRWRSVQNSVRGS